MQKKDGKISQATTLLRDLHWEAQNKKWNAFFMSLDFKKAYDSIDHQWLFATLEKMNFPNNFINVIKSLCREAYSEILVNGFKTPPVSFNKGVRQGDPLSSVSSLQNL